jgi:uncharacterized caspase-like protein
MKTFTVSFTVALTVSLGLLMCLCTVLSLSNPVFAESLTHRKALLIGNYKYKKRDWRLKTPKKDIQALKSLLKKSGFQVTVRYNLKNKRELDDVVADFGETLDKNSIAFIHYAGHGVELNKKSLILGTDSSVRTKAVAEDEGYPVKSLVEVANRSKEAIVSIDACRNNPFYHIEFR